MTCDDIAIRDDVGLVFVVVFRTSVQRLDRYSKKSWWIDFLRDVASSFVIFHLLEMF